MISNPISPLVSASLKSVSDDRRFWASICQEETGGGSTGAGKETEQGGTLVGSFSRSGCGLSPRSASGVGAALSRPPGSGPELGPQGNGGDAARKCQTVLERPGSLEGHGLAGRAEVAMCYPPRQDRGVALAPGAGTARLGEL